MSTRVLLATLSIPITPERTDIARLLDMDGIIVEKHRRLATLLGLQSPPTRQSLINDMVHYANEKITCIFYISKLLLSIFSDCQGVIESMFLMCAFQVRFNLLQYVVPDVKELYNWLEVDFHPLKLSGRVTKVTKLLKEKIHNTFFPQVFTMLYSLNSMN